MLLINYHLINVMYEKWDVVNFGDFEKSLSITNYSNKG